MGTTALFVELLVIGMGTFLWLACLVAAVFGIDWVPLKLLDTKVLLAMAPFVLAINYLFGIVWDRVADIFFGILAEDKTCDELFPEAEGGKKAYFHARRVILIESEQLTSLLEYGRSRLRICRGWCLNACCLLIAMNFLIYQMVEGNAALLHGFVSTACLLLVIGCGMSWYSLMKADYKKVKRQSTWLENHLNPEGRKLKAPKKEPES